MKRLLFCLLLLYRCALADQTATVFYDPTTHKIKKPPTSGSTPYDLDFTGLSVGGVAVGSFQPSNDFLTSLAGLSLTDSMFYMVNPGSADIVTMGIGLTFSAGTLGIDPTVISSRPEDIGPTSDDFVLTLDSTTSLLKKVSLLNFASQLVISDVVDSVTGFTLSFDTSGMTHDSRLHIPDSSADSWSVIPAIRPAGQFVTGIDNDGTVATGYWDVNNQASFSADQHNLVPTADSLLQRWSSTTAVNVGGMVGGINGEPKIVRNVGTNNLVLLHESSADTAANRFHNTSLADITLGAGQAVLAIYDSQAARWRLDTIGGSTASAVVSDTAYPTGWAAGTTIAPSQHAMRSWMHSIDSDDDGRANVLNVTSAVVKTDAGGAVSAAVGGTDFAEIGANTSITSLVLNNTGLRVKDTGGTNRLILRPSETNTADRTLFLKVNDVDRTLNLGGNLITAGAFSTSGANALTLTTTGTTNATIPVGTSTLLNAATAVTSAAKNGSTALHGAVTFSEGSNITLTQSGNDILIASTGGGGGVTSVATTSPITGGPITSTGTIGLDTGVDFLYSAAQTIKINDATANAVSTGFLLEHDTTGTPAIGLGTGMAFFGESSTTVGQPMGQLNLAWSTVTDASRTAYMDFILTNNGTAGSSKARLFGSGGFSVNSTTDPGAGVINANTGFKLGGAEFPIAANGFVTRTAANTYSATTAPSGAVVGTTDSQALTNKDLSGSGNTFPTFNQNTTGSAGSLSVSGQTGLLTVTGLTSTNRAKTVRDAADTILELGGSYTPTGTWTGMALANPVFSAGSSSASTKPKLTSGTVLATPEAGALEYDGAGFYATSNTTSGREAWETVAQYMTTGDGSASGTATITDMFPATSSFPTVTNGIYEIIYDVYFSKATAGTMTFTVTNTQTYTNLVGFYQLSNASGIATAGTLPGAGLAATTTAAAAFPATASLTTAVNHHVHIRVLAECATAGNIRLRGTPSAGTFTTLRGSHYTVRRWTGNVGAFVN